MNYAVTGGALREGEEIKETAGVSQTGSVSKSEAGGFEIMIPDEE